MLGDKKLVAIDKRFAALVKEYCESQAKCKFCVFAECGCNFGCIPAKWDLDEMEVEEDEK